MSNSIVEQSLEIFDESFKDSKKGKQFQKSSKKRKFADTSRDFSKKEYSGENIDQLRKKLTKERDRTQENLRKLLSLSGKSTVSKESSALIFKRASRAREEPEVIKPVEGTVFTEEDFLMFEREYVVD